MAEKQEFKEFESPTLKDFNNIAFNPTPVAGINVPQINQAIGIET